MLYGAYLVYEVTATEQLEYSVLQTSEAGIELREYAPFIVAEIDVQAANPREAASKGFKPLAGYIFGDNTPQKKIKMTAPVSTQTSAKKSTDGQNITMTAPVTTQQSVSQRQQSDAKKGESIAMTAPVATAQNEDTGSYTVQFSMPSKWSTDTLPQPANSDVRLTEKPAQLRLAKTYRGDPTAQEIATAEQTLVAHAESAGLTMMAEPIWAGYSSPAVPKPLRKWEILLPVEQ